MTPLHLLVEPDELDGSELEVAGEAYRHLFRAARAATGDAVRVVDGQGRAREGRVASVDRRSAVVRLGGPAPALEPRLRVELLVAVPRPSRASWLVEKGTELGVWAFRFVECERSVRGLDGAALERLRRVARAAVEQCGRSRLPELTAGAGLEEAVRALGGTPVLLLDPGAPAAVPELPPVVGERGALAVGPEGGFTAAEIAAAERLGARRARLLPAAMRVETAALAGAAWLLIQSERAAPPPVEL